jgi:hypothetical protein
VTTTTQQRNLPRLSEHPSWAKMYHLGVPQISDLSNVGDYTKYPTSAVWQPTQETTSYRTSAGSFGDTDPLSEDAVREFQDVFGNGFVGETPRAVRDREKYDNGHPFFTTKTGFHMSHPLWDRWAPSTTAGRYHRYRGPLLPRTDLWNSLYPPIRKLTTNDVSFYGAKAIAASAPTAPQVSLATSLGELLREGLPAILGLTTMQGRVEKARSAGSAYLNHEFGWVPLLNDVRSIARTLAWRTNLIRQFERDGGKVVRRRYYFPNVSTTTSEVKTSVGGPALLWFYSWPTFFGSSNGGVKPSQVHRETILSRDISFSGAFQYAVPKGRSLIGRVEEYEQKANFLLGTSITPETLWNLAPWTWLLDWWYNIGDLASNATYLQSDGLVMRYGYLMCHTREFNRFYIPSSDITFWGGAKPGTVSVTFTRESKERYRASPYGFSQNPSSFTARQWAILGALGLTRAPGILP